MKRILAVGVVVLFLQPVRAVAVPNPDTGPGCGLGKTLWSDSMNQKNILPQVLMATTNVTGFHTFAISSGTSGCTNDGKFWAQEKVNVFAVLNFENLAQDMAQGQGEHLASLATLMGISVTQQPAFFAMTQEKYASLVAAGETSPVALVEALNDAMATYPMLAKVSAN